MKYIEFKDMHHEEFYVKNIKCDFQVWDKVTSWCTPTNGRINTAVMLLLTKNAFYKLSDGNSLYASPGDIVLLPKGSIYSCSFFDGDDVIELKYQGVKRSCLFLGFELFDKYFCNVTFSGSPRILFNCRSNEFLHNFEHLCKVFKRPNYPVGMLCSQAAVFLASLCERYDSSQTGNGNSRMMDMLVQYIYDNTQDVTVDKLIGLSGMSASTLRRRFAEKLGMSPVTYINSVKIEKAKSLFESGVSRIKDVSLLCGIEDEFYFSRLFSKTVGVNPSVYLKKIKDLNK